MNVVGPTTLRSWSPHGDDILLWSNWGRVTLSSKLCQEETGYSSIHTSWSSVLHFSLEELAAPPVRPQDDIPLKDTLQYFWKASCIFRDTIIWVHLYNAFTAAPSTNQDFINQVNHTCTTLIIHSHPHVCDTSQLLCKWITISVPHSYRHHLLSAMSVSSPQPSLVEMHYTFNTQWWIQ